MKGKMYLFLFYLVIFAWGVVIGRDSWRPEAIDLDDYETKSCSLVEDRLFGDKFPQKFYEEKIAKVNDVPVEFRMDALSKLLVSCFLKLVNVNAIVFHYGYTKRTMKWWVKDLRIGYGYPDWGAEQGKPYFVFELGGRIY